MRIENYNPSASNGIGGIMKKYNYLNPETLKILEEQGKKEYFTAVFNLLENHHPETVKHILETAGLSYAVGKEINLKNEEINELVLAALYHDTGKLAVENIILNKPGKPTISEFEEIKKHSFFTKKISQKTDTNRVARIAAGVHKFKIEDPYPDDLEFESEDEESQAKRLAIIDSFHAIVENRPYNKGKNGGLKDCEDFIGEIGKRIRDLDEEDQDVIRVLYNFCEKNLKDGRFNFN